jgi:3'(2'), 5'-bisphosphate nucleotidase
MVMTEALTAIAHEAGYAIQERLATRGQDLGADGSTITASGRAAHAVIEEALARLTPDVPIVSEASRVPSLETRAGWARFWLVDALDGTQELLSGLPGYTVNIALVESGVPIRGLVHTPARGITYWAAKDEGSWRQGVQGRAVRIYSRPPAAGSPLRLVESPVHRSAVLDAFARQWPVSERIAVGSSLKFCWIAEGRADAYPCFMPVMEWDVAAGDCVFRYSRRPDDACRSSELRPNYSPLTYDHVDCRIPGFVVGFTPPPAAVVWFTGLPGAGKTTIARAVQERLGRLGAVTELLDGDEIREVFPNTGFSREARDRHIRRVGHLASRLEHHGVTSLVSLVSPYRDSRDFVRSLCHRFIEVYVSTAVEVCEQRDPKGLYRQARAGTVQKLTGVADPYEPPSAPELTIDTATMTVDAAANLVMDRLLAQRLAGVDLGGGR